MEEILNPFYEYDGDIQAALYDAAWKCEDKVLKSLIDSGADINYVDFYGNTPLHHAVEDAKYNVVKLLLDTGANVNLLGKEGSPLEIAITKGRYEVATLLIDRGANKNIKTKNKRSLAWAYRDLKHKKLCELFLLDSFHFTWLKKDNIESFKDYLDDYGNTPLHLAVLSGNQEMTEILVSKGDNINARDNYGQTPLHFAVMTMKDKIVEFLLESGADKDSRDNDGNTPLHLAVVYYRVKNVELLIRYKADLNAKDYHDDSTPLHIAAYNGNRTITKLLVEAGANKESE